MSELSLDTSAQPDHDELLERLRSATIGKYDIYAEAGRGGMAVVYLALDLALNRKVAIKAVFPDVAASSGAFSRFRREVRTSASLSHPNIVPIYSVGDEPGLAYFVMKYIPGRGLDEVIRHDGAQAPEFVHAVLRQVGSALDYAHRSGVVHRDVKSANIMLDDGGWAVLTDFGIAKTADSPGLTSAGMIIGTPAYMSPEQFTAGEVGPAADQYALGCVAFELLAGRRPMIGSSVAELMRAHMLDEPPRLCTIVPQCPPDLDACVHRMLAKQPEERFASLADAIASLRAPTQEAQERVSTEISRLARTNSALRPRISEPRSPSPGQKLASGSASAAQASLAARFGTPRVLAGGLLSIAFLAALLLMITRGSPEVGRASDSLGSMSMDSTVSSLARESVVGDDAAPVSPTVDARAQQVTQRVAVVPQPRIPVPPTPPQQEAAPIADAGALNASKPSPERQASNDSTREQTGNVVDSTLPREIVASPTLVIGTRISAAWLYIDDDMQSLPVASIRTITIKPGLRRIRITTNGCLAPWDTSFEARAGEVHNLSYKNPQCDPPR